MNELTNAHLYPDEDSDDQSDESDVGSKDNTSYYCGVCNINFLSEHALTEHKCTHKLCGIDDCTFVDHLLIVAKQISMQHNTDPCTNLKDLSKEEAARKWTEERKKRFPTKVNIMLCQAGNLEKLQRGETIQQRNVFKVKATNKRRKMLNPYSRITHKTDILQEENSSEICLNEQIEQTDFHKTADNTSDKDDVLQADTESKSANLFSFSLVTSYKIKDEDAFPMKRMKMRDLQDHEITENTIFKGTSNYAQSCINASENKLNYQTITEISQRPVIKYQDQHKHKTNQIVKDKRYERFLGIEYHNNFLARLLSRSIQHERNLIFQSLKYIVEHNFFESPECGIL